MKIFKGNFESLKLSEEVCIALGTFDGVHRGHQAIIREAVETAKEKNLKSAVLTFDIHPRSLLYKVNAPKLITDNQSKSKIIETLGVDYLLFVKFDESLRNLDDLTFLEGLVKRLNAKAIVCGYNYTFGKGGRGNSDLLNHYSDLFHFDLKVVDRVSFGSEKISSTVIREKISQGNIKEANRLLGYNLFCIGEVVKGKGLAHTIGFPTANVIIEDNLCFKNGVYITLTHIDNSIYPSITNVGYTPTVESKYRVMETNIFDFSNNIYGKNIKVEFLEFLRGETKFPSVEDLIKRVNIDIKDSKEYFKNNIYNN
ncbi:bifunctional riboflavin kinase/FAD synthetase [Clostridium cylindrosporum]|uniref:Riboflavin biosynthesis protein n=1 Tax=Clostridium cylindrosporum DSM 605 TaxID=1121307 RepID=A0A0J8DAK3_CLOCY|nr:bifunctional riboflavin kinase/FAD synthetase [Clostridium cylindrosporum]KMT23060.1 riboflavin biosynthesis protein RibC [Clostridium cylindrosporum DSM 605]